MSKAGYSDDEIMCMGKVSINPFSDANLPVSRSMAFKGLPDVHQGAEREEGYGGSGTEQQNGEGSDLHLSCI